MKKTNLWVVIAIVIIALLSCLSLWFSYQTNQQVKRLRSDFDNHLLYSEFQNDTTAVVTDTTVVEGLKDSLMQQKESEIKSSSEGEK